MQRSTPSARRSIRPRAQGGLAGEQRAGVGFDLAWQIGKPGPEGVARAADVIDDTRGPGGDVGGSDGLGREVGAFRVGREGPVQRPVTAPRPDSSGKTGSDSSSTRAGGSCRRWPTIQLQPSPWFAT